MIGDPASPPFASILAGRRGLAVVLALTALAFAPSLSFGWVYDDVQQIVDNETLLLPGALERAFSEDVWAFAPDIAEARYYRPVFTLWLIACRWAFGLHAPAWHASNVLLHLGSVAVLWFLVRKLSGRPGAATLAAALFALHPTRAESVAWVCGSTDPLAALTGFGAVLVAGPGWRRHALSSLLFGATLLAKETGLVFFVFPAAIAIAARLPPRNGAADVLPWRPAATTTGIWALLAAAYLVVRGLVIGELSPVIHHPEDPAALACALVGNYSRQFVAPGLLSLVREVEPATAWAIAGLLCWTASALLAGRARSLVWMGGLFLLPVLRVGTLQPDMLIQDRYLYLPSACWFGALAWGGAVLHERRPARALPLLGAAAVALCLAGLSVNLPAWRDDRALWERAVEVAPGSGRAWFNLGVVRENEGDLMAAEDCYERATLIQPERAILHFRLALMLAERNEVRDAWLHFSRAADLRQEDPMMLYEAGRIEAFRGDLARAGDLLARALASVDGGAVPAGGILRADIERELDAVRRRRQSGETPRLRWE